MSPLRTALRSFATLGVLAAVPVSGALADSTVSTYPSGAGTNPGGLTMGPDGAVWFTQAGPPAKIGRVTLGGQMTSFTTTLPDDSLPDGITTGGDDGLWFAAPGAPGRLARMTSSGTLTSTFTGGVAPGLTAGAQPTDAATGSDGAVWFTEAATGRIGRITPGGGITEYTTNLPTSGHPSSITPGPGNALWFVQAAAGGDLGRITPQGSVTYIGLGSDVTPRQVTEGPDGALWVTAVETDGDGVIVHVPPSGGTQTRYVLPGLNVPDDIVTGGDDALWFSDVNGTSTTERIGRLTTAGDLTLTPLAAGANAVSLIRGPGGNVWFTQRNPDAVARITVPPFLDAPGPWTATAHTAQVHLAVRPNAQTTTYLVRYGTSVAYGLNTSPVIVPSGGTSEDVVLTDLQPNTLYHARVEATNATGTAIGPDLTFKTGLEPPAPVVSEDPAPPPATETAAQPTPDAQRTDAPAPADDPAAAPGPAPVLGKTVVVEADSGKVRVRAPGSGAYVDVADAGALPVGSLVDARKGTVALSSVRDATGAMQTGRFSGGLFEIRQSATGGVTELALKGGDFSHCPRVGKGAHASAAAKRRRTVRSLWGSDNGGRFRTRGRDSVATVRGTRWRTVDSCDGTLIQVASGKVLVARNGSSRGVLVGAGHSRFVPHGH